jgi:predicted ATPase
MAAVFLRRVRLKNYKSIGACDVELASLTFLVGPNGAGKSNFLDALRFVTDALNASLDHAIRDRGGVEEVRRRSGGHPNNFGVHLEFALGSLTGHYAFEITARPSGTWAIKREECSIGGPQASPVHYLVQNGIVTSMTPGLGAPPAASSDRLYLVHASGISAIRPLYDALARMGFYSLSPAAMRELQPPDLGHLLKRDGSNAASVLHHLEATDPQRKARMVEFMERVVPGVTAVQREALGPRETIEFRQEVQGAQHPWRFRAANMSDGTVRVLGILLALNQVGNGVPIPLIGIEEPETALHPAALGVLADALRDASTRTQVIVTSHSPDLLDDQRITDSELRAVVGEGNETLVGPLDARGRQILRDRLSTPGELLRMGHLLPDADASRPKQGSLFDHDDSPSDHSDCASSDTNR